MVIPLDTKYDKNGKKLGKICWGGSIEGIDCGDEVAEWLSWNMDRPGLRLVRCTGRNPPDVNNYGIHILTVCINFFKLYFSYGPFRHVRQCHSQNIAIHNHSSVSES